MTVVSPLDAATLPITFPQSMAALPALVGSLPDPPLPHLLRQEPRRRGRQRWAELRGQGRYFDDVRLLVPLLLEIE